MMPRIWIHLAADLSARFKCLSPVSGGRAKHACRRTLAEISMSICIMPCGWIIVRRSCHPIFIPCRNVILSTMALLHSSLSQSSLTIRFTKRHSPKICITLHYVTTDNLGGWVSFFACARQDAGARSYLLHYHTEIQILLLREGGHFL